MNRTAPPSAPAPNSGGAVENPTGDVLIQEDGYADEENRRRARNQGSGKTRVPDQAQVMGSKGRNDRVSPQRQQAMERMQEQARMQKRGDETDEQAFSRFITSDRHGREMFAEYRNSQLIGVMKSLGCAASVTDEESSGIEENPNPPRTVETEPWDGTPASALEEVEERVRELMEDEGLSEMMAYERAISEDPTRFAMAKRHTVSRRDV